MFKKLLVSQILPYKICQMTVPSFCAADTALRKHPVEAREWAAGQSTLRDAACLKWKSISNAAPFVSNCRHLPPAQC